MAFVRLTALSCTLVSGCFFLSVSVPDIPETTRPTLPEDKFLDLDARTERVKVNYEVETGRTCVGTSCAKSYENRTKKVSVRVAQGSIDGRPVSIRELAVMASPDFVKDTDRVAGLMSACRRGRIAMSAGFTAAVAGAMMLQAGFDEDRPNRNLAIGGYAALGVAIVGVVGGYTVFGAQHCKEGRAIYERWKPIYRSPDKTELTGETARMYEALADKFNADRAAALGMHGVETSAEAADQPTDQPTEQPTEEGP